MTATTEITEATSKSGRYVAFKFYLGSENHFEFRITTVPTRQSHTSPIASCYTLEAAVNLMEALDAADRLPAAAAMVDRYEGMMDRMAARGFFARLLNR